MLRVKMCTIFLAISLCFFVPCFQLFATERANQLDGTNLKEFLSMPVSAVVHGYRMAFGKGIRSFCPMHPSCSTYGLHAVRVHGLFGFLDITDRLFAANEK
ncbi:MAG: hypothetical protein A3G41_04805 [Elusimicrobia bacterium RIFCSPLOWO2_12_FULL_59_9]|nr:MAG: hypothetical protein A3G41_04805 [Elusimicrobia bacterium RIFCSPLOWO2_12_FULL_59_9]